MEQAVLNPLKQVENPILIFERNYVPVRWMYQRRRVGDLVRALVA